VTNKIKKPKIRHFLQDLKSRHTVTLLVQFLSFFFAGTVATFLSFYLLFQTKATLVGAIFSMVGEAFL